MTATSPAPAQRTARRVGMTADDVRAFAAELRMYHVSWRGQYKPEVINLFLDQLATEFERIAQQFSARDKREMRLQGEADRAKKALKRQWRPDDGEDSEEDAEHAPFRPRDDDVALTVDVQLQADRELERTRAQMAEEWRAHRVKIADTEQALRDAIEATAAARERAAVWPLEPQSTGDPSVDLVAEKEHQQQYRAALKAAHDDLDGRERALGERQEAFLRVLGNLMRVVPEVHAEVIDLTGDIIDVTEKAAS